VHSTMVRRQGQCGADRRGWSMSRRPALGFAAEPAGNAVGSTARGGSGQGPREPPIRVRGRGWVSRAVGGGLPVRLECIAGRRPGRRSASPGAGGGIAERIALEFSRLQLCTQRDSLAIGSGRCRSASRGTRRGRGHGLERGGEHLAGKLLKMKHHWAVRRLRRRIVAPVCKSGAGRRPIRGTARVGAPWLAAQLVSLR
jgi:hypothetical protein